jgi:serine/threonine protein kinase/Flp pilus assembly protein TadD
MEDASPEMLSIFGRTIECASLEERAAFLDSACGANSELRQRIEVLLQAHDRAGGFLHDQPEAGSPETEPSATERSDTVIGPYRLMEQIGEGGMGLVYVAEQHEPVRRKVALKLIKPGMDTRDVIARFEAERQALALMDHPNIAKVLDAGATPAGRPYFVMELVKGMPITQYCDEHRLTPHQRLELFTHVCHAVQHAHQKGIIHRDIKPTNVLIASHDGRPVVKVIDFGVAKAIGPQLTEDTIYTAVAQMVGTPLYMSPEQAGMSSLDIDTRTDIYSLGVLLYELLTGTTPFDKERLKQAAFEEIRRIIREEEPQKPSTRISTTDAAPSIAAQRDTEPAKLAKLVRGDLDWIVMKALEKDRNRRYETANGFAADVLRYLADEPVLACPPSTIYRLKKFARRNKAALGVSGLVCLFLVLLGGAIGWAMLDKSARQARISTQVDTILTEVERLEQDGKWVEALEVARRAEVLTTDQRNAATQERVRRTLNELEMVNLVEEIRQQPSEQDNDYSFDVGGMVVRYREAFKEFGVDLNTISVQEAAQRLRSRPALGMALTPALDHWAIHEGIWYPDRAKQLWAVANAVDPDPWRRAVREASQAQNLATLEELANAPDTARQPPQSQILLMSALQRAGQRETSRRLLERACRAHPADFWLHFFLGNASLPAEPELAIRHLTAARALRPKSTYILTLLGKSFAEAGRLAEAQECYTKAIELDPQAYSPRLWLGYLFNNQGKLDDAIASFQEAFKVATSDGARARAELELGRTLEKQGRQDEALGRYQRSVELGPECSDCHVFLADLLQRMGRLDEAVASYRRAIEAGSTMIGVRRNLAITLKKQGRLEEAITVCREELKLRPDNREVSELVRSILIEQGKQEEASELHRSQLEKRPDDAGAQYQLGRLLQSDGKLDEAIVCFKRSIELAPKFSYYHQELGRALDAKGLWQEAVASYQMGLELEAGNSNCRRALGEILRKQGKLGEAITLYEAGLELDPNAFTLKDGLSIALSAQGSALHKNGMLEEAVASYRRALELFPGRMGLRQSLGLVLRKQGRLDEEIALYKAGLALNPDAGKYFNGSLNSALQLKEKMLENEEPPPK